MRRPALHIENIFDVLNPTGHGVNGYLKLKAIQLQDRVAAMASDHDVLVLTERCPQSYLDYLFRLTGVRDVLPLRYHTSDDLRHFVNARNVFEALTELPEWRQALERDPFLAPYFPCPPIYEEACRAGLRVGRKVWKTVVIDRVQAQMNDKGIFHDECEDLGLPTPPHWFAPADELSTRVLALLRRRPRLYVRALRSAGSFENVSVYREGKGAAVRYGLPEVGKHGVRREEFAKTLEHFARSGHSDRFIISMMLDLYASPGTAFAVSASGTRIICHAYQRLTNERRFFGFIHPITDEKIVRHFPAAEKAVLKLAEVWRSRGFRGYGNVDWMVTPNGEMYFSEMNARQTASMPAINIENRLSGVPQMSLESAEAVSTPRLAIVTGDRIQLTSLATFEEVHSALSERGLLWEQRDGDGMIIYIPPVGLDQKTLGIACYAPELEQAYGLYRQAEHLLGSFEGKPLFTPPVEKEVA